MSVPARQPRRLWRLAAVVVICLLIGAAVNVLVTWSAGTEWKNGPNDWPYQWLTHWPHEVGSDLGPAEGISRTRLWNATYDYGVWRDPSVVIAMCQYGFPLRSMQTHMTIHEFQKSAVEKTFDAWTFDLGPIVGKLPLRPLWPGFAANTLIYAALAYGLSWLPFMARRWRRGRRNQCPNCGYDRAGLAADAKCPECGADRVARSGTMPA